MGQLSISDIIRRNWKYERDILRVVTAVVIVVEGGQRWFADKVFLRYTVSVVECIELC